ncbi:MAG: hypothetical protein GXZ08_09410 [Tissierellia bacterium]|nr:hypothetical protein [Tissierellia bacterium]
MNASKKLFMVMVKLYSLVAFAIILLVAFMSRPFMNAFYFLEMQFENYPNSLMLLIFYFGIVGTTVHSKYLPMAIKSGISRKSFLYSAFMTLIIYTLIFNLLTVSISLNAKSFAAEYLSDNRISEGVLGYFTNHSLMEILIINFIVMLNIGSLFSLFGVFVYKYGNYAFLTLVGIGAIIWLLHVSDNITIDQILRFLEYIFMSGSTLRIFLINLISMVILSFGTAKETIKLDVKR